MLTRRSRVLPSKPPLRRHRHCGRGPTSRQRGLSLVELMVGIAVGMFIVAAAATLIAAQLSENRKLLLEVQVQQDLRATADIVTRDLRRAGASDLVGDRASTVWDYGVTSWSPNLMVGIDTSTANEVDFASGRVAGQDGPYGYRLRSVSTNAGTVGVVESELGPQSWQPLTDSAVVNVTGFTVTAQPEPDVVVPCPKLCPDGTDACWPRLTVRKYLIDIAGQSVSDASVKRRLQSVARIRNEAVVADPANAPGFCPA